MGAADEIFVARYGASGALLNAMRFGDEESDKVNDLAVDSQGWVYITGEYQGEIPVHGQTELQNAGLFDAYVMRLGPPLNGYWGFGMGDAQPQTGWAVAVDAMDNAIVVGNFSGDADFGSGLVGGSHSNDLFIAKFGP
jgi:hypothetical protein